MMERKLKGTTARLNSLKELLFSSTNSSKSSTSVGTSSSIVVQRKNRTKNSISLFNLNGVSAENCSRPISMAVSSAMDSSGSNTTNTNNYNFTSSASKSVSMFGLVEKTERSSNSENHHHSGHSSKNPAARFFYTIRSKFRERRRDRSKIVDSKSADFGTFLVQRRPSASNDHQSSTSTRYQLKSSQSAENIIDNFSAPIGYRNECENDRVFSPSTVQVTSMREVWQDSSNQTPATVNNEMGESGSTTTTVRAASDVPPREVVPAIPPKTKCLTKELQNLTKYGWYWGGISKDEAEEKLRGQPDGAFCVRDSSSDHYLLSLSFNSNGRTLHTRIEYRNGEFRFYSSEADSFPTVAELIEHCIAFSEGGIFCYSKARRSDHPSYPVRLTKPISRFSEVKSLLHLSRFVIRKHCRVDLIPQLPLPPTLIAIINNGHFLC